MELSGATEISLNSDYEVIFICLLFPLKHLLTDKLIYEYHA